MRSLIAAVITLVCASASAAPVGLGVYVTDGKINRDASVRLQRQEQVVCESIVSSLRRFKADVKEVASGYECGVGVKDFNDFQVGDMLEFFRREKSG